MASICFCRSAKSPSSDKYLAELWLHAISFWMGTLETVAFEVSSSPARKSVVRSPEATRTTPSITATREPLVPWFTEKIVPFTETKASSVET